MWSWQAVRLRGDSVQVELDPVRVDTAAGVLTLVGRIDEEVGRARYQQRRVAENEHMNDLGRNVYLPAALGEGVGGDEARVVGRRGVKHAAADTGELLDEVVVVVAERYLVAGDLDPRGADGDLVGVALVDDLLGDDAAHRIRVDVRHTGEVGELGGLDGDSGHR